MRRRELIRLLGGAAAFPRHDARAKRPQMGLHFTYSAGYRHDVIPHSRTILTQIGKKSGVFEVTATDDPSEFSSESLKHYAVIMFFTTDELPLSGAHKTALLNFVHAGGGFLGVHSATDTFYNWPEHLDLIGGCFNGHPWRQTATIDVVDLGDPLVAFLGSSFRVYDESAASTNHRGSRVLLRLNPSSVELGKPGVYQRFYGWPLAWTRSYGQGPVFYIALGHEGSV